MKTERLLILLYVLTVTSLWGQTFQQDADYTEPGRRFKDCETCPEMVVIPAGSFAMGGSHEVSLPRPFAVGVYEVTVREWNWCATTGGCRADVRTEAVVALGQWLEDLFEDEDSDTVLGLLFLLPDFLKRQGLDLISESPYPVTNVSWHDAQLFIAWVSERSGRQYRLLSSAEWEYVARSGTTTPWHTGETIFGTQANFDGRIDTDGDGEFDSGVFYNRTQPVGLYNPNSFGVFDMHGNVWEWTEDCYHHNYIGAPGNGIAWTEDCQASSDSDTDDVRILRGGSYTDRAANLRSANRASYKTYMSHNSVGFRVARDLHIEPQRDQWKGAEAAPTGLNATIRGSITFEGVVRRKPAVLNMEADPVCADKNAEDPKTEQAFLIDESKGLANVLIQVKSGLPDIEFDAPESEAVFNQSGCIYDPHILIARVGQTVRILNPDGTLHNVHVFGKVNQEFNQAMPKFQTELEQVFDKVETDPFAIKCDVHPWMNAFGVVLDHPYAAVTAPDGSFSIPNLPAGTYQVEVWHELLGSSTHEVTVTEGGTATLDVTLQPPS